MVRRLIIHTYRQAKRVVVIVIGFTILLIGIVMIALPGPAILVIPAGLTILATEFLWARRLLQKFKETTDKIKDHHRLAFLKEKWQRLFGSPAKPAEKSEGGND
jgi:uncharacterized protein (TIGR02611 family)